jgi:phage terminase large subunit
VTDDVDAVARRLKRYREGRGILQLVDEEFKASPDPFQEDTLLAFASADPGKQRISMQACTGPGKSTVMSWCGWWFLGTQGEVNEHPKGAAVSVTKENLTANLWAEFNKWQQRSPYFSSAFTWTSSAIFANDHPATWRLDAKAWPKTANADEQGKTLSGLHAKYVVVLIDESGAIPATVLRAGDQALSACTFGKMLQGGNPISLDGMLYAAANQLRHQWYVIRVTGDPDDPHAWVHSPRLRALHKPDATGACTCPKCWAAQQIATYGRENPWVKSYILGQFPPASINALLGVEEVEAAMRRQYTRDAYDWSQKRIGVDVARFGDDRTVLFPRQGCAAFRPIILRHQRTTAIAARVAYASKQWGGDVLVLVDDTGHWGHGVIDNLLTANYPAMPITSSDPGINKRYKNRRAEMWLEMAEWVKGGGALPYIPEMIPELTTPTYTFLGGKFLLEEKDQVKMRLGRSPDLGDGLAHTFAIPDQPNEVMARMRGRQTVRHEFDPFAATPEEQGEGHALTEFNPFAPRE